MSGFALKMVAIITMLIDHIAASLNLGQDTILFGISGYMILRSIGRIAFPIFAYFVAEGCAKTRDIKKYILRLFMFGLLSETPFQMAFLVHKGNFVNKISFGNVFYTLGISVLSIYLYEEIKNRTNSKYKDYIALLPIITASVIAQYLHTDYGATGVLIITALYIRREQKNIQLTLLSLFLFGLYMPSANFTSWFVFGCSMISVILISMYNGERGRSMKYLFYAFYPIHLTIISLIKHFVNY